jgi:hypothetical protein
MPSDLAKASLLARAPQRQPSVWCHPERTAEDLAHGNDYYLAFATYPQARAFARRTKGAEQPLALIRQREYLDEPSPGAYKHVRKARITEWPVRVPAPPAAQQADDSKIHVTERALEPPGDLARNSLAARTRPTQTNQRTHACSMT